MEVDNLQRPPHRPLGEVALTIAFSSLFGAAFPIIASKDKVFPLSTTK